MTTPLIEANAVDVQLDNQSILQSINLSLHDGEIVTIIGPNGAGKTTLVKALLGLIKLTSGTVKRRPGMKIGYVPQRMCIDSSLPLSVKRFLQLSRQSITTITQAAAEIHIKHLLDHSLHSLSGGEWQRVLLTRALLRNPQLLVLDEPAQGVDIAGQAALYQLISSLRDRHQCGVLMVSHDLHIVMAQTDTVICLNQHICCQGKPEHISHDPAYLTLFGERHIEAHHKDALAIYQHRHDHRHDIRGKKI